MVHIYNKVLCPYQRNLLVFSNHYGLGAKKSLLTLFVFVITMEAWSYLLKKAVIGGYFLSCQVRAMEVQGFKSLICCLLIMMSTRLYS